jgi:alpha-glucosidase (family GH31 glycosyl hydrolase)
MFGDDILIAPVLETLENCTYRMLYLPKGTWIDYWTKDVIHSNGQWIKKYIDLETMPMYVKAGSIIPYGVEKYTTNNEIGLIDCLEVYLGSDGALTYNDGVTIFDVSLKSSKLTFNGLPSQTSVQTYGDKKDGHSLNIEK